MNGTTDEVSAFSVYNTQNNQKKSKKKNASNVSIKTNHNAIKNNKKSSTKIIKNVSKKLNKKKIHEIYNEGVAEISTPIESKKLKSKISKKAFKALPVEGSSSTSPKIKKFALSNAPLADSEKTGADIFKWLLDSFSPEQFFSNIWEKGPLHIKRRSKNYFAEVISTAGIDLMFRNYNLKYTKNVDITSYTDGKRETLNPEGRVHPPVVWDYYSNGCSIRLLNPQTYCVRIQQICAALQEYFGSFVGANIYLTPPGTQGFAPHYDDIEAFILQIEGKKRWRIYPPRSGNETLPRYSSPNFTDEDIGEPIFDGIINAGDMLYFPRGYIHQGNTLPDAHSLHITLSTYQKWTWGDLCEKIIPIALQKSIESNVEFRKGLPVGYLNYMGIVNQNHKAILRKQFEDKFKEIIAGIFDDTECVDLAVDQMAKQFQHDALPPVLTTTEKELTVFGDGEKMIADGEIVNRVELEMDTEVRLLRKNILRVVFEDNVYRVYYYVDNSKEYHSEEQQCLEIDETMAHGVEYLIHCYPHFVRIETIPIEDEIKRIQVVSDLWETGLIMTSEPLPIVD